MHKRIQQNQTVRRINLLLALSLLRGYTDECVDDDSVDDNDDDEHHLRPLTRWEIAHALE